MKNNDKLINGSLWKNILIFTIPVIFSNLLQVLFNLSDIAVAGKFSGSIALGAVGSTSMLVSLFTGLLMGIGVGINVLVARYKGAGDINNLRKTTHTGLIISLLYGIVVMAISLVLAKPILVVMNTKDELINDAVTYIMIYFIGLPALSIYNYGNGVYSAVGNTKRPLIFIMISGLLNISLNLLFVAVFHLGVKGLAFASIISQYILAIVIVLSLKLSKNECSLKFRELKIDKRSAKDILFIGIPSGFQCAIFALGNLFVQSGVNSFDHIMVEGNSAAMNADTLVYEVMYAFYTACASFVSQNFGANKKDRVLKSYLISMFYAFSIGAILGLIIFVFDKGFLSIFSSDEEVIKAGSKRLRVMCVCYCTSAFLDTTTAACRGLGKTLFPTIAVICGACIFRIIWVYTIFKYLWHTIVGLYIVYIISWGLVCIFEIPYFIYIYKKAFKKSEEIPTTIDEI